ncbi:MAG TPA: cytochrome c biogenesis protein CcdA [Candidatus Paceibacterota bacterium]
MSDLPPAKLGGRIRSYLVISVFALFAVILFGLLWLFFLAPSQQSGFGWYVFSFAAGLSMIVLPCTLPLAFVIVPLSMGKGVAKGLGIALSFGSGVALMLSIYGVIAAAVGGAAINGLGADLETVKNWVYFIAGIFALIFALGEIGLLKFRMPSYTGAAPAFIQKKQDFIKAFLLGMFLGNIGVGCPHPATPLILVEIASSGQVFYGWTLFLIHAIGRILPLLFLALLGILGVNGLSWLVARKEKVEKATGWAMVFVAGFILTLGLFTHKWWVNSGIHTLLERVTGEEQFLEVVRTNLNSTQTHRHGLEMGTGLFGLPLWLGNWFLVLVWVVPLWWWWFRERKRVSGIPPDAKIDEKNAEHKILGWKEKFITILMILFGAIFIYILPQNFLRQQSGDMHALSESADHEHTPEEMMDPDHIDEMANDSSHMNEMGESDGHGHSAQYHEETFVKEGIVVNLGVPANISAGETANLAFYVNTKPASTPVVNLELGHKKYLHVIGVRSDLSQFFHIHPENSGSGFWSSNYAFKEEGKYKLFTDIKYAGQQHTFGHGAIAVRRTLTSPKTPAPQVQFFDNVIVGNYQVALDHNVPLVKGKPMQFIFTYQDVLGNGVELEPYLGADMHLVVIKDDLSEYVHAHPDDSTTSSDDGHDHEHTFLGAQQAYAHTGATTGGPDPAEIPFTVTFPKEGIYKLFGQFRPKGTDLPVETALLAEFYVKVESSGVSVPPEYHDHESSGVPSRALMVVVSLILMTALSYGVAKFLKK